VERSDVKAAEMRESVADARDLAARRRPTGIFQSYEAGSGSNATSYEAGSGSNATGDENTQVGHRDALAA
jgi:hypothetical protein